MSSSPVCSKFSIKEIEEATNKFDKSRILGEGAEAKVYQAEMHIGSNKTPVAVKHYQYQSKEFEMEIQTFSRIHHPNIVSLLGYCNESGYQVLVYEYMVNGCLSDYLKKSNPTPLSWLKRLSICLDVACGLLHIHTPTPQFAKGIVHRDVKPGNILLDKNWVGKLSDFGIIKLSQADQEKSQMATTIKGTSGYFAPEYHQKRIITRKIDVFSFGVVLFRVLCRKSPWDRDDESYYPKDSDDLGLWAQQNIDLLIREEISVDSLNLYTDIIGKSLKADPGIRPAMKDIVLNLHKALEFQKSPHSEKLTKLPELPVEGTIVASFRPESSRRFSLKQIKAALLAMYSSDKQFSIDEIKAALLSFSTFKRISLKRFSLDEIKVVTNDFDNNKIIGKGGLSIVYFAEMYIDSNKFPVALKHLNSEYKSEFDKTILTSYKIQHPNLVSLIGYCDESDHHILVYEYMAKGCLSDYLKRNSSILLTWLRLLNICLDVARGLQFLHAETNEFPKGIVHRLVTPANILVDENWTGKLSNSDLYKVSNEGQDVSMMTTILKGTSGYLAPEYVTYKRITRKVDVYSFGGVLFQVLCRKHFFDRDDVSYYLDEEEDLGLWAQQNVYNETKAEISDDCLAVYTDIIGRCLKMDPGKRPTMEEVVMDLQKAIEYQNSYGKRSESE